jgi:hypothetical protein
MSAFETAKFINRHKRLLLNRYLMKKNQKPPPPTEGIYYNLKNKDIFYNKYP